MRILVAEDDLTSRTLLVAMLGRQGYEVVQATDGAAALQLLLAPEAPQLAILDWMMPEMDGLEVIRQVRNHEGERRPYLIMLTARDGKDDVVAGLDAGADDYLAKPFDPGELRSRVQVGQRMVEMQNSLLASREALAYEASHCALTGLLNRRAILESMYRTLEEAAVSDGPMVAIGLCDIDHFKRVNDGLGHQAGDEVLRSFSQIALSVLDPGEVVGRLGGEEFLIISAGHQPCSLAEDLPPVFERLRARIAESRFVTAAGPVSITVSTGVAFGAKKDSLDELLEASDRALYKAKSLGRNRVEVSAASERGPIHSARNKGQSTLRA